MSESAGQGASGTQPQVELARDGGRAISDVPVLALIRPLAVMAIIAMILGRIVGPSSAGLVVGFGKLTRWIELAGAIATQLFAMAASVITMAEIIAVTKSRLPTVLRVLAVSVGGFGVIVGLSAAVLRVPGLSAAILGAGAAVLAIVAAWDAARAPFARVFAFALGLLALAALARLVSAGLADVASERASLRLADVARGVSTATFAIEAAALLVSMSILAYGDKKVASPITMVALLIAFIATRQALVGDADDAGVASVLLRRAADRLMTRPEPFIPIVLRIFVGFLAVVAAIFALFAKGQVPALSGALSLALLTRGAPDMPLGAVAIIIAALTLALAARDDRGVWASILAGRSRGGGGGEDRGDDQRDGRGGDRGDDRDAPPRDERLRPEDAGPRGAE